MLEGSYGCEVTADESFHSQYLEANMSVAVVPDKPPLLRGVLPSYDIGEYLKADCTSSPSHPPAALTFLLNDKEVIFPLSLSLIIFLVFFILSSMSLSLEYHEFQYPPTQ